MIFMEDQKLATVLKSIYIVSYHKASQIPSTRTQKKYLCRHIKESADAASCAFAGELSVREEKERERNATQKVYKLHGATVSSSECIKPSVVENPWS